MRVKLLAELIGTFWLVPGGRGSAVVAAQSPGVGIGLPGVSLAFGLTPTWIGIPYRVALQHDAPLPDVPGRVAP